MPKILIEAKDVHKTYGKGSGSFEALKGVDLNIEQGESLAIIGKSGSGKSTLMHLLAGLDRSTSGSIAYQGKLLTKMNEGQLSEFRNKNDPIEALRKE